MRFIRDIIEEKKSAPLVKAASDVSNGLEQRVAQDGGAVALPDPRVPDADPAVYGTSAVAPQSDEQALRNIFKSELAEDEAAPSNDETPNAEDVVPGNGSPSLAVDMGRGSAEQTDIQGAGFEHGNANPSPLSSAAPAPDNSVTSDGPNVSPVEARKEVTPPEEGLDKANPVEVPQPAAGRMMGRSGRVKTRVLGFGNPQQAKANVFSSSEPQTPSSQTLYPVGWLVLVDGPGKGSAFTLHNGVSSIGRNPDQTVALAFGDNSISRENHAAIAYDVEQNSFFLGHGSKANLVRLNGRPVLSTEELKTGDVVRIGETTMRFVALCGDTFSWSMDQRNGVGHDAAQ